MFHAPRGLLCFVAAFACAPANTQPTLAPEPHFALDEFVRDYTRYGLPAPPKLAQLVRVQLREKDPTRPYQLALRVPAARPGGADRYLIGTEFVSVAYAEPVAENAVDFRDIEPRWASDLLYLAIQCRLCERNERARALFALVQNGRKQFAMEELRLNAYAHWHAQIPTAPDRREVLRYLTETVPGGDPDTRDLERTVAPRKTKPGSVESLVEDLLEYRTHDRWYHADPRKRERGEEAYRKLVELGFDAVPTLIEYLNDWRFTRFVSHGEFPNEVRKPRFMRVGSVASHLLDALTDGALNGGGFLMADTGEAREWWTAAQKMGEEKWLVSRLTPEPKDFRSGRLDQAPANRHVLRVLGAKYPKRLVEFYRTVLQKHPDEGSLVLASEIAQCHLPKAERLALLEEGAAHKAFAHRYAAIAALASLDDESFRKNLIAMLKWLPDDIAGEEYWVCPEATVVKLVRLTDAPACWDAFAATARRVRVELRKELVRKVQYRYSDDDKSTRRERIRFLVGFLDDESTRSETPRPGKALDSFTTGSSPAARVSELALSGLAFELGVSWRVFDTERGAFARMAIRAWVTKAATEVLQNK